MPAKIYLFLTVISTLVYLGAMAHANHEKPTENIQVHSYTYMGLFTQLTFAVLWVVFLNYLCSKGYEKWSWFFLMMPIILMAFMIIMMTFLISYTVHAINHSNDKTDNKMKQMHQEYIQDSATQKRDNQEMVHQLSQQMAHHSVEGFQL
jgi:hypothetical protein